MFYLSTGGERRPMDANTQDERQGRVPARPARKYWRRRPVPSGEAGRQAEHTRWRPYGAAYAGKRRGGFGDRGSLTPALSRGERELAAQGERVPGQRALGGIGRTHDDAPGMAPEIAVLRTLLDRALAPLKESDTRVSLAEVEALSRIMGRLGSLLAAQGRAGGGQHLNDHVWELLPEVGREVGTELGR